jgi:hypothetical protein
MKEMEKGYPYDTGDEGSHWSLKRPWDMVEYAQPDPVAPWQDQGKRHCLPDSFGDDNTQTHMQMQMPSDTPLDTAWALPNAVLEPTTLVKPSVNLLSLSESRGPLWSNDGSGASPVNLQAPINQWTDRSLQPAAFPTPSSSAFNTHEELWTSQQLSEILGMSSEWRETESMVYARSDMRDDLMHYPEDSQMSLTNLDLLQLDFLAVPKPTRLWNQPNKVGNDMALTGVGFSGVETSHFPTRTSFWREPDQLSTRTPHLQLRSPGVGLLNSCEPNVPLNQDSVLHWNVFHDTTIQIEDQGTESKTSEGRFVQSQRLDSFGGSSIPPSMNNESSQTLYEYNQNAAASDNGTARLVHDSEYPSRLENVQSVQFETDTLQNGFAEDCSSFQAPIAQNHGTLHNALFDRGEETNIVEYDTCFGTVSLSNGKPTTYECS